MEDKPYKIRIVQHEITIEREDSGEQFTIDVSTKDKLFHAMVTKHTRNKVLLCKDKLPLVVTRADLQESVRAAIDAHLKRYHPPPRKKHLAIVED